MSRCRRFRLLSAASRKVTSSAAASPREILGVGGGKRLCIGREQLQRVRLVEAREQRRLEIVRPGAHGERRSAARAHRRRCAHRSLGERARDDVDAGEVRFGDLHLRFHADRRERLADDALDALAHLGVVLLARHENQARIEAPERDRGAAAGARAAAPAVRRCPSPGGSDRARSAWNSSSRGKDSRMCCSALPSWLSGASAKCCTTWVTLWRTSGISRGVEL